MSDHGFGPQHKLFRINQWLIENGFLRTKQAPVDGRDAGLAGMGQAWLYRGLSNAISLVRSTLPDATKDRLKWLFPRLRERVASEILFSGVDWSGTRAYHTAEFPGSIRVNLKGRETQGAVEPGPEYEAVCRAIQSELEGLTDPDTGERVVERVFRREELYAGPFLELAPDLIVHLADYSYTFDWYLPAAANGARRSPPVIDALSGRYAVNCGYHRRKGVIIAHGPSFQSGVQIEQADIQDVIPTALYLLGLPIPADMDGRVLTEALTAKALARKPVVHQGGDALSAEAAPSRQPYSEEEAQAVADRLRQLGYL